MASASNNQSIRDYNLRLSNRIPIPLILFVIGIFLTLFSIPQIKTSQIVSPTDLFDIIIDKNSCTLYKYTSDGWKICCQLKG